MVVYGKSFEDLLKIKVRMKKIILPALLSLFVCHSAQAFTVSHDFTVILGVFNASKTNFSYSLSPENYAVNSTVKTAGLFDSLYPFEAVYATTGKIKKNGLETASYKYHSKSRFSKRSKELVYDKNGNPLYRISSKNDKSKKVKIEENQNNADTTDLQTVLAKLAKQYNELRFCDSRMEVFDGKRRFDVIFKDEGIEELSANDYSDIEGKAAKCSMYIDKLNSKEDDLLWELTSERPIYFWLMEDKDKKVPFIAKISINETPLGKLDAYAKNITVKDN